MARLNVHLVLLVALAAVFTPSVIAGRHSGLIRQPVHKHLDSRHFIPRTWGVGLRLLCIPDVSQILEDHEGRHKCAYDHTSGYRAVGVAYNLDDDVDQRKSELSTLLADYEKVYKGEDCLNNLQITALLALDAQRALDRAAENVKPLDDFCCSVQAVFADVQHSVGSADKFPNDDLETFIEKAALKEYKSAAHALERTQWCSAEENKRRCDDNLEVLSQGCD
ncbi:hypothetical protein MPTK1_5g10000 [Marchantia polymorpha subsp. ruderalis]|nr:hypothetical protein MARPO_0048s0071 [Marchantia polymorpha]BBN11209.1 hypothetical protein Mp_5g10000 [Marchantia polymorpha subsp. ruderalis]|eukprot:PTQ38961.1 hypothetical protein MARPO_0048s0071 [Marchantia polymorpha]